MSRILRRPMFRKGGSVGEGIMSKVQPRYGFNQGGNFGKIYKQIEPYYLKAMQTGRDDTIANLLIRGGMGLIERSDKDAPLLQQVVGAFKQPTEVALKETQQRRLMEPQAKLAALGTAAKIAGTKYKPAVQNLPAYKFKTILDTLEGSLRPDDRKAAKNFRDNEADILKLLGAGINFRGYEDEKDPNFKELVKDLKTPIFFYGNDGRLRVAQEGRIIPVSVGQAIAIQSGSTKKGG